MTIKELYERAKEQGKEDYVIVCDDYGELRYAGEYGVDFNDEEKEVIL